MTRARLAWVLILSAMAAGCGAPEEPSPRAVPAPRAAAPTSGPLSAAEGEGVRGVSRAILLAQRDTVEDVDVLALGGEVEALRRELEEATRFVPTPIVVEGAAAPEPSRDELKRTEALRAIRERADALGTQRALLSAKAAREPGSPLAARAAAVGRAAERIEADLRDALDRPDAERTIRLLQLKERLQRQTLSERQRLSEARHPAALSGNGNTSLTKHR